MDVSLRPVKQWNELHQYIATLRSAVTTWKTFFGERKIDWMTERSIQDWLGRLDVSFVSLRDRFVYDDNASLDIVPTNSGFPQHYHIEDIDRLALLVRSNKTDEQGSVTQLKRVFLDQVFEQKTTSQALLYDISQAGLTARLRTDIPYGLFTMGQIMKLVSRNNRQSYSCVWEQYTIQPLPIRYVMVFEADRGWSPEGADLRQLAFVLQQETLGLPKLAELGGEIDRANARVYPKWIGRIILGPIFIARLTKDDHKLQQALDAVAVNAISKSASRIIYEYVLADSERVVSGLFDPQGVPHVCMQHFAVRLQGEHFERQVTHLEKHLFAPHDVIQQLDEDYRKEIGHQLNGV
jgi:hypothetical protein